MESNGEEKRFEERENSNFEIPSLENSRIAAV